MTLLTTYNRVRDIAAGSTSFWLNANCVGLTIAAVVIAIGNALYLRNDYYYWLALMLLVMVLLLSMYRSYRSRHCRFCGGLLDAVPRAFNMQVEHLSSKGLKGENCFYMQKKTGLLAPVRWVKLHNQSRACHTCRICEEGYQQYCEPLSGEEKRSVISRYKERYHA